MKKIETNIEGVYKVEQNVFADDRGYFFEGYNEKGWLEAGLPETRFVQENQSYSKQGVLRGLHYQANPDPQAKLVLCTRGRIFDVAVDIRPNSPTFMQWYGVELVGGSGDQLFIPPGCLHGFYCLEESEVRYKTDYFWNKAVEGSVRWNDEALGIKWPISGEPILSQKDAEAPLLADIQNPF